MPSNTDAGAGRGDSTRFGLEGAELASMSGEGLVHAHGMPLRCLPCLVLSALLLCVGVASARPTSLVNLLLPEASPEVLLVEVGEGEGPTRLRLHRHSLRSEDFRLLSHRDGVLTEVAPPPSRTYRGTVDGEPDSLVLASLGRGGLTADVLTSSTGTDWSIRPTADGAHRIGPFEETPPDELRCGVEGTVIDGEPTIDGGRRGARRAGGDDCTMSVAQIAFDADNAYHVQLGDSLDLTLERIEWMMQRVDVVYARDVQVTYEVTAIVVREDPFYVADGDAGAVLDEFREHWNTSHGDIERDMAHLMTARDTPGIAGLAWVGVVCTDLAYAWSNDWEPIIAHELGHNWGAGHCQDPVAPPHENNILCGGGGMWIGPVVRDIVHAHRDSRGCLDTRVGPHLEAVPPYADRDVLSLTRDELASRGEITLDVLANDVDANCDELSLVSFDTVTALCGRVECSVGTGPFGRDELTYHPPAAFVGRDEFTYVITDTTGLSHLGVVTIDSGVPELIGYWPLDETEGELAADLTRWARDGVLEGGVSFTTDSEPGVLGNALSLGADGVSVTLGGGQVEPPWTAALWVMRRANENTSGVLLDAGGSSLRLEQWNGTGRVGFTRYGVNDWAFAHSAPLDTWQHLCFVGTEAETSLWVDGVFSESIEASIPLPLQRLGRDGTVRAVVDEVRAYSRALEADEIAALVAGGGPAESPSPALGDRRVGPDATLSWTASPAAVEHDVYLGVDRDAVAAAETSSPEYLGRVAAPPFSPGSLTVGRDHYWRVDEVLPSGDVLPGVVWDFRVLPELETDLVAYWPFDDTVLDHAGQGRSGGLRGDASFEPGPVGAALELSGPDQSVRLFGADVAPPWTWSGWVRRSLSPEAAAPLMISGRSSLRLEQWPGTGQVGVTEYGVADWVFDYAAPVDEWVHLMFVATETETALWVDGALTDTIPNATVLPLGRIGATGGDLRAGLDEVAAWSRALNESEIQDVHAAGLESRRFTSPCPCELHLLRDASITSLSPVTPPLADVLAVGGLRLDGVGDRLVDCPSSPLVLAGEAVAGDSPLSFYELVGDVVLRVGKSGEDLVIEW
ncbi:MAG: LamG-like jellyroll fold domain-containing protein [Acidobacteriota bacterium]